MDIILFLKPATHQSARALKSAVSPACPPLRQQVTQQTWKRLIPRPASLSNHKLFGMVMQLCVCPSHAHCLAWMHACVCRGSGLFILRLSVLGPCHSHSWQQAT